ncbi:MAG: N-acetylmuramoyl-L-alanine amidase [Opitutae bacterium]|nr:N-acetylmuramoyl-L-alanine amidase [Opitutae bacterium]
MARLSARGLLAALAVALAAPVFAAAPARVSPTRPAAPLLWPTARFADADYVDAREIAERYGLKIAREKGGQVLRFTEGAKVRLVLEDHNRDFYFDGLRVFLGRPALGARGTLWVSKLDVIKLLAPLLRPRDHARLLPAAAPQTIVLDAGHGGTDPGKENRTVGVNEKTLALDVVLRLKKLLEAQGWRVLLTRSGDTRLAADQITDLRRRAEFANQHRADLFLSVHFNSAPAPITGVETYTMAPQFMLSTADDRKDEMTDKAFPGNKHDDANLLLGEQLHRALLAGLQTPDRGFKRGRLHVLRFIACPGALVECAYLSSDAEARRAATPEFREQIARALADGLKKYSAALEALRPQSGASAPAAPPPSNSPPPARPARSA